MHIQSLMYMLALCQIMSGEALMHYYKHINHLIIWYGWTVYDLVSFVSDMGQQSSLNLLVLNGKWSSCELTVFTEQETFLNWRVCRYVVLHAVAVECFEYMYFFYWYVQIRVITFVLFLEHLSWIFP
jgi:hypothetical protein